MSIYRLVGYGIVCLLIGVSCQEETTLFGIVDPEKSGVDFSNQITEDDSINILVNEYVYNGAGVAIADVNNDGLVDLFFSGNQVENRLYLNRGNFKFEDVTEAARIAKENKNYWSSGVNIIDVNHDGLLDIYICNTMSPNAEDRRNLLYVNTGISNEVPKFVESAQAYGLDSDTYSSHAQFFDYDNDGDLDVFIGVNQIYNNNPNQYAEPIIGSEAISKDRLLENIWNEASGHPVFKDISVAAGIEHNGYSHSTLIHDFNDDGWADIYVANDYISNDLVFINNQDGTYTNKAKEIFKHFSLSAMGSDLGDVNNDGKVDMIITEMQPYYNKRKKLFHGESSYTTEILRKKYNHAIQYTRNTLQLNLGTNPVNDLPIYGDVGIMAGVQETDWSWATLFADYDNDGWQDIFIANGFPKDVTDRDFSEFSVVASRLVTNEKLIEAIPEVKTPNFLFRNNGDLSFEDVSKEWGFDIASFSNGAAYGDLDNDGDLDLVTNNINDPVFIYENKSNVTSGNYLRVALLGSKKNPSAIGASVTIYFDGKQQTKSVLSGRGYLSQSENTLHFGLGTSEQVDSVVVTWPGGETQKFNAESINTVKEIAYNSNSQVKPVNRESGIGLFEEISDVVGIKHYDKDPDFIDFNIQRTIPHKLSQYGPALAVGDVNGDSLDDLFVGGGYEQDETWFIQQSDGSYEMKIANYKSSESKEEDVGVLLFDADGDDDLDLYIVRGSAQFPDQHIYYQDVFLINDGAGNYERKVDAIPDIRSSGSCVKAADYDMDGDLDLFIGSRVKPGSYPDVGKSYLLRNESAGGKIKFVDATEENISSAGLVSDALWTDLNNDNWPDLVIASEWSALQIFINEAGALRNITTSSGLIDYKGWWNSLKSIDMDNDGDLDFVAGNFGDNTYFKCSTEDPIRIYGKDFDNNGSIDPLISCMWVDSLGDKHEYPYHPYMDMGKQVVSMRKKFANYGEYGEASMAKILEDENLDEAILLSANYMKSSWVENLGSGKFEMHALPIEAQLSPVYGIQTSDIDADGNLDLILVGNDHGVEVQQGRADASVGLVIFNRGGRELKAVSLEESNFFVPGDARSLVAMNNNNEKMLMIASQNKDSIRVFTEENLHKREIIKLEHDEVKCEVTLRDNTLQVREYNWGDSFQSQSSRVVVIDSSVQVLKIYNNLGKETRVLNF